MGDIMLRDIADVPALARSVLDGWVDLSPNTPLPRRVVPMQPLLPESVVVACYTRKAQYDGHWEEGTTMLCRGLVLDAHVGRDTLLAMYRRRLDADALAGVLGGASVLARGMRKFFTVEAAASDWGRVTLGDEEEGVDVGSFEVDVSAPSWVSDKVDGALAVAVPSPDGSYACCTKGSATSDEALFATECLRERHDARAMRKAVGCLPWPATPLFEVVGPQFEHVVDYGDAADVTFLGVTEIATGVWHPWQEICGVSDAAFAGLAALVRDDGYPTPETMPYGSLMDALKGQERPNREGVVVTSRGYPRTMYKVKYERFLEMQRIVHISTQGLMELACEMPATALLAADEDDIARRVPAALRAVFARRFPDSEEPPHTPSETIVRGIAGRICEDYALPLRGHVTAVTPWVDGYLAGHPTDDVHDRAWRKAFAVAVEGAFDDKSLIGYVFMASRFVVDGRVDIPAFAARVQDYDIRRKLASESARLDRDGTD